MWTSSCRVVVASLLVAMVPFVNNIIIAPHGITDLIHAHHNDLIKPLLQIYGTTFTASQILHITHLDTATHILFAVASIAHFRHDLSSSSSSR